MKKLVVLLLASLVATSAFAVMDPDENSIGIYFDLSADNNCYTTIGTPFFAYLIATNPTATAIGGYELGFNYTVPEGTVININYYVLQNQTAGGSVVDVGARDPLTGIGDYIAGFATPIPASQATLLHTWQFLQLGAAFPMQFFLTNATVTSIAGATTPILLNENNDLIPFGQSTGGRDIPVAVVNDATFCPVGVEEASFGSVKSLFR